MFYFPITAQRATQCKTRPSSRQPRLEMLESRLVPSLPGNGTILFTNYHGSNDNNSSARDGIVGVDPNNSWQQSAVAVNGSLDSHSTATFSEPDNLCENSSDDTLIYVTDLTADSGVRGAVLQVKLNANTGPTVTELKASLDAPSAIEEINGNLWVLEMGTYSDLTYVGSLVELDLSGNVEATYSLNPNGNRYVACPVGIAPVYASGVKDTNHFYLMDEGGDLVGGGQGPGKIYKVTISQLSNGIASALGSAINNDTSNNYFDGRQDGPGTWTLGNAQDVAIDTSTGNLYVPMAGQGYAGSVVKVDTSGNETLMAQDGTQSTPDNMHPSQSASPLG